MKKSAHPERSRRGAADFGIFMQQLLTHFEAYLLTHKRVAHNTYMAYKRDIEQLIAFLKKQNIETPEKVTKEAILAFLAEIKGLHAGARTLARKVSALRNFLDYAKQHHSLKLGDIELTLPKVTKKLPLYCTPEEIQQIFAACNQDQTPLGQRNKMLIYMLYTTGVRVSELISIQLADIHYDTGMLHIRGKGGKMRIVPLMQETLTALKIYSAGINSNLLFPLTRQAVSSIIKKLLKKTTIVKPISAHTFRHSLATHGLQQGWDLRSLQLLLGHEHISTVEIYTHVEVSHLQAHYKKRHPRS